MQYNRTGHIYQAIVDASIKNRKLLAILIDPEKVSNELLPSFLKKVNESIATHVFVGGSTSKNNKTAIVVQKIKDLISLPVLLFPGDYTQLTSNADGLLFLSLISGRNPEYLIGQQVLSIRQLRAMDLEIIPTGYMLIDGGIETAVERVSNTKPMSQSEPDLVVDTALAGEYSGKKLIYLEAGSGADLPVDPKIIASVKKELQIPLIVGGGIRSKEQLDEAYAAGADMVVIGNALEKDLTFFEHLKKGK